MKDKIHPKYVECKVTCGCGNAFTTRSTSPTLSVEVCSKCHPLFTGQQRFVDTAGRVERFQRKYAWDARQAAKAAETEKPVARPKRKAPSSLTLHTTSRPKPTLKTPEGAAAGGPGGRGGPGGGRGGPGGPGGGRGGPGGAGGPGGGRPGGGRGGRGGRGGPRKDKPVSTERLKVAKPRPAEAEAPAAPAPAEAPKVEVPKVEVPKTEAPQTEAPKQETPKGDSAQP